MKTIAFNLMLSLSAFTLLTSCQGDQKSETATGKTETNQQEANVTYTCPMHPEVISNRPGKCPECGMNLKEKDSAPQDSTHAHQEGDQH